MAITLLKMKIFFMLQKRKCRKSQDGPVTVAHWVYLTNRRTCGMKGTRVMVYNFMYSSCNKPFACIKYICMDHYILLCIHHRLPCRERSSINTRHSTLQISTPLGVCTCCIWSYEGNWQGKRYVFFNASINFV